MTSLFPYENVCNAVINSIYDNCNNKKTLINYKELIRNVMFGILLTYDIQTERNNSNIGKITNDLTDLITDELQKRGYFT